MQGCKIEFDKHYVTQKRVAEFKDLLLKVWNLHISQDNENIHPTNICSQCCKTLLYLKKNLQENLNDELEPREKKMKIFDIYQFTAHTNACTFCTPRKKGRPTKLSKQKRILVTNHLLEIENIANTLSFTVFEKTLKELKLCMLNIHNNRPYVEKVIKIAANGSWSIEVLGMNIKNVDNTNLSELPMAITADNAAMILENLKDLKVCPGNDDFYNLIKFRLNNTAKNFKDKSDEDVGILQTHDGHDLNSVSTIRHKNCNLLVVASGSRCGPCSAYRTALGVYETRRVSRNKKRIFTTNK